MSKPTPRAWFVHFKQRKHATNAGRPPNRFAPELLSSSTSCLANAESPARCTSEKSSTAAATWVGMVIKEGAEED